MSVIIPVGIGIALLLLLAIRRSPSGRQIARSLAPADREFIADQLEPITRLPVRTAEEEDAWYSATRSMMERLQTRFPDVASVVPHQLYHYFSDADIYRKQPSFRATWERYILEFIRELRAPTTKT